MTKDSIDFLQNSGLIAAVITGVGFLVKNYLKTQKEKRVKQDSREDLTNDKVEKLLQERVDVLEKKVTDLETKNDTLTERVFSLEGENGSLKGSVKQLVHIISILDKDNTYQIADNDN